MEALSYLPNRSCPFMTVSSQHLMLRIHSNALFFTGSHVVGLGFLDFSAWESLIVALSHESDVIQRSYKTYVIMTDL